MWSSSSTFYLSTFTFSLVIITSHRCNPFPISVICSNIIYDQLSINFGATFDILLDRGHCPFACQLVVWCSWPVQNTQTSLPAKSKLFVLPQGLTVCCVYVSVCLYFPARQLYASPVWRSGYSPTSSRRCHTRTGHGSHAQNCLNRSQTSTHLLWRQIGGCRRLNSVVELIALSEIHHSSVDQFVNWAFVPSEICELMRYYSNAPGLLLRFHYWHIGTICRCDF